MTLGQRERPAHQSQKQLGQREDEEPAYQKRHDGCLRRVPGCQSRRDAPDAAGNQLPRETSEENATNITLCVADDHVSLQKPKREMGGLPVPVSFLNGQSEYVDAYNDDGNP